MSDGKDSGSDSGAPPLVPQVHGGAIFRGGKRGNKGGKGAVKSAVRAELLRITEDHAVPFVEAVLTGEIEGVTVDQQERVAKLALQYGLGQQKELTAESVRELLAQTVLVIREEAPDDVASRVLARMREIWR